MDPSSDARFSLYDDALLIRLTANDTVSYKWEPDHPSSEDVWRSGIRVVGVGSFMSARLDGYTEVRLQGHTIDLPFVPELVDLLVDPLPVFRDEFGPGVHLIMLESFGLHADFIFSGTNASIEVVDQGPNLSTFETSWSNDWNTSTEAWTPLLGHYAGSTRVPVEHEAETLVWINADRWTLQTNHCKSGGMTFGDRVFDSTDGDFHMHVEVEKAYGPPFVMMHTIRLPNGTLEPGCTYPPTGNSLN